MDGAMRDGHSWYRVAALDTGKPSAYMPAYSDNETCFTPQPYALAYVAERLTRSLWACVDLARTGSNRPREGIMVDAQGLRFLVQQDGSVWTAQCVEYDIGAQANSLEALRQRVRATVAVERRLSVERTGQPFGGIDRSPAYVEELWHRANANLSTKDSTPSQPSVPEVSYEMKLCA